MRACPPAWRHTALFSSSLFSPLLPAIHLRCAIFFPSLNRDSCKRVSPINNDTMMRIVTRWLLSSRSCSLSCCSRQACPQRWKRREKRDECIFTASLRSTVLWRLTTRPTTTGDNPHIVQQGGWALQCHHCHCHCHRIIWIVDQVRIQTSVPYLPEEHAESETAAGDGTGNNNF